ncbi:hypothetical protein N5D28_13320 [Stutzerimonas stutzeri]|uniref:hypothetical protein n=1 Tax=Stutzerimonas stutzeri TaxID=316 RepID=UPI00244CA33E|nr:hypothetical protein [Stutzerimonas stutzeri]MDH0609857.1 hypothetical protein [Stutzerimonas stutzeri]
MTKPALQKLMINIGMAAAAALLFTLLFGTLNNGYGIMHALLMTVVFGVAIGYMRSRIDAGYEKRINADANQAWEVQLNGVPVGHIPDQELASIQRRAFQDPAVAIAQGKNLLTVSLILLAMFLVAVPITSFWLVISTISQDSGALLAAFNAAPPGEIATAIIHSLEISGLVVFAVVSVLPLIGIRFGYQDEYRNAVTELIRTHCKAATVGTIELFHCLPSSGTAESPR